MKNIILTLVLVFSCSVVSAQSLSQADINYFKKLREIRTLEKQKEVKEEAQRIAVSAVKTSHQQGPNGIQALSLRIQTAEDELEALP